MKDDDTAEELAACGDDKDQQRNIDIRNVAFNVVESAGSAAANIVAAVNGAAKSAQGVGDAAAKIAARVEDAVPVLNSPEQVQTFLDACYRAALDGIPKVSSSVDALADDYCNKYGTTEEAARQLISNQLVKCSTSGFLSGVGGALTLPATVAAVSANVGSVIYMQMRMVAALAQMGGYDIHSDQVQTMVYVCLTGKAMSDILKSAGIKTSERLAVNVIKKLPGSVCTAINRRVGMRFVTKFGEKGVVNLGKMVPVVGGVVGGGFDFATTKTIGDNAYRMFIAEQK